MTKIVNKKMLKDIEDIMIEALQMEVTEKLPNGKEQSYLSGYICHKDIPEETPEGFHSHFSICGEADEPTYLVLILEVPESRITRK